MPHLRSLAIAGMLAVVAVSTASCARGGSEPAAGDSGSDGLATITKAGVVERMLERSAPHATGAAAPSFVVDPGWPKPLPNNWRLGQIGGLFVDRHDTIWVYHRPRSLSTTEAGALDAVAKDAKGNAVSALGHPRAYGQYSACCVPAPSVLRFDKAGNLLQSWG